MTIVRIFCLLALGFAGFSSGPALADPAQQAPAKDVSNTTTFVGKDSTNIDFSAANIDGKMQAPSGFFLQGRNSQSMSQMVKLRSKFRSELRDSKSAVKALIH